MDYPCAASDVKKEAQDKRSANDKMIVYIAIIAGVFSDIPMFPA